MSRRALFDLALLFAAAALALLLRRYAVAIYQIPSESMLPNLLTGDVVLVSKWRFAVKHELPQRGAIVVVHVPPPVDRDYVKRVIGLPGDRIGLRDGIVLLNKRALPRARIADLVVPVAPNSPCRERPYAAIRAEPQADGTVRCRYARYREKLPDGSHYDLLDLGRTARDDFPEITVPSGQLFLLGDNRDLSADSRVPPVEGGTGLVAREAVVGRATRLLFSVDGSARWDWPESWARAIRWRRIGLRP